MVGSGAREHAIGWQISRHSPEERELFFAPGNGGTAQIGQNVDIGAGEIDRLAGFAQDNRIGFTIVGPERLLADGIVNTFQENNLPIFGHTKEAAVLEADKAEAVLFMRKHSIPHPASYIFTDSREAELFIKNNPNTNVVVKASGLAEGKGVILPDTEDEAIVAIRSMMVDKSFGKAGEKIVIQERLVGREVSVIGFVGNEIGLLVPAQDYKRAFDGDVGLNTGGMGSYAPNDFLTMEQLDEVRRTILLPTKEGMEQEGRPLTGILYAGLMLTPDGIKVIEYNVRFGDPETQVQLRLLQSDILLTMRATMNGNLREEHYLSGIDNAVGVVIAAEGYPGSYKTGGEIKISDRLDDDIVVFHGGTRMEDGQLKSSGGRILTVTATGSTREIAIGKIYDVLNRDEISVANGYYRNDIAK